MTKKQIKRLTGAFCAFFLFLSMIPMQAWAKEEKALPVDLAPNARSAILIDADSGAVIYEKNSHDRLPPASITKVMTMLLIMDALESKKIKLNEKVRTSEYAASMGGSQIFLEPGEEMTVDEMLKGIAMASGNDASVAMAEKIAGSEEMFVQMMNDKANELGLKDTHFTNSNGLPAEKHYSSAHDIAIISKALLRYPKITAYTSKYQDYLRKNSEKPFWLVNTNKLVRFYDGADGLKTGYTSDAKFCLTATAKRNNFRVIAVVMGEPNSKTRNAEVTHLFDYSFSQYSNMPIVKSGESLGEVKVSKGKLKTIPIKAEQPYSILLKKGEDPKSVSYKLAVEEKQKAPIQKGQQLGKLTIYKSGQKVKEYPILSPVQVDKASWWILLRRTAAKLFFMD